MEHREDHNEIPEFTLEDILAEFGSGSDLYRTEDLPAEETPRSLLRQKPLLSRKLPQSRSPTLNRRPLLR